jgi:hypothetical protein
MELEKFEGKTLKETIKTDECIQFWFTDGSYIHVEIDEWVYSLKVETIIFPDGQG